MREAVLSVAEAAYRMGIGAFTGAYRRRLLRKHRLAAYVVSLGNLTWGGTGKTPLAMYFARVFEARGRSVAVLTRGYGRDEVQLMTERLKPIPVVVGPDRLKSGLQAIREYGADLLLLDDGYQQWRIHKDLEILAADAAAPFDNGHLIPRGTLREPKEAAGRADLIILKKGNAGREAWVEGERQIRRFNSRAPLFWMGYRPVGLWSWPFQKTESLEFLKGRKVATMAGLADPGHFEETVRCLGAEVEHRVRVRDHHRYTTAEMIRILSRCLQQGIHTLITTAKDAVRIPKQFLEAAGPDLRGVELFVLEVVPEFEPNESQLLHRIDSLLAR